MTLKNHREDLFTVLRFSSGFAYQLRSHYVRLLSQVLGVVKKLCEAPKTRVSLWVKNAAARSDHVDLGIYEFTRDIFKKSPRELVDAGVGQDSSPLCQWLYLRENMARPEWIYGMFLLVCRPEGKPPKIQPPVSEPHRPLERGTVDTRRRAPRSGHGRSHRKTQTDE